MYITVTQIWLGAFDLNEGKLIATDPCYTPDSSGNCEVEVKKGEYHAKAKYGKVGDWGERVVELTINHASTPKKKATTKIGMCAVDSGQCGFFELEDYIKFHPNGETAESEAWYNRACKITLNDKRHNCGMMTSGGKYVGAMSESGLGDGYYELYAGYNSKGEVTALRLRFI